MGLFRRKKREGEDEDEELDEEEESKPKSRPRKKKSEPPKPWGRKERLLVLAILVLMVGTSGVLALSARSWKLPGFPKIGLPKFSLFEEGTVVINKKYVVASQDLIDVGEQVKKDFTVATKNLSGVYGLYVVDLDSGYSYGVSQLDTFQAASLIKLPVMVGMYIGDRENDFDLDDTYRLTVEDKIAGSGSLYGEKVGSEYSYRDLLRLMGKQSDNTAFGVCRDLLGAEKIEETIDYIGMTGTNLTQNETTPQDIGTLFVDLWDNELLGTTDTDELLSFLVDTSFEDHLAAGVSGVKVAHKYGREVHTVNDAGIVYTKKPYVVVLMTKGIVESEADAIFPELSKIVFEAHSRLE